MNIYILLDRSGSMDSLWKEAIGSINSYVEALETKAQIVLAAFDSVSYDILRICDSDSWKKLSTKEIKPRGTTPLYDSAMKLIRRINEDNPEKAVFVVMTDGFENASHEFNNSQVTKAIKKLEKKNYQVVFLGANFAKIDQVATDLNIEWKKFLNITPQNMEKTMRGLSLKTSSYAMNNTSITYSDDEKSEAVA